MSILEGIFGTKDTAEAAIKEIEEHLLPKAREEFHAEFRDSILPLLKDAIAGHKLQAKVKVVNDQVLIEVELVEKPA